MRNLFCAAALTFFLFLSVKALAIDFTVPESMKQKYQVLYSLPVKVEADGSKTFHQAKLFQREGVRVLFLKGDAFEMAFQHGKLLREEIHEGVVPQASLMMEKQLRNGFPQIPIVTNVVINTMYRRVSERMLDYALNATKNTLDEAYGLTEGSGISLQTLLYAAVGPESLQVLLADHIKRRSTLVGGFSPECSAFAAWGKETSDGGVIIGRNTDYPLNGYYDRFPTVFYFEPTDGTQKYMAVSSAGIHNAGVVGFNQSGLYFGVHTVPTTDASAEGVPAFFLAQHVLKNAKNLDEAVALFSKFHSAAGWTYMVVDTKQKKAVSVEIGNSGQGVLKSLTDSYHVQTNHYRTPEMSPRYLSINVNVDRDTYLRLSRIEDLLKASAGSLDARKAANILSDKLDPMSGKTRGLGNTVSVHTTMTSVVFDIERQRLFVGAGKAPVANTKFVEFPLVDVATPEMMKRSYASFDNDDYAVSYPQLFQAEQQFINAKIAYETDRDFRKAFAFIKKAVAIDAENPYYHFVAGILALKANDDKAAWKLFDETAQLDDAHQKYLARYYQGRMLADYNDRKAARDVFTRLLDEMPAKGEAKLRDAAQTALSKLSGLKAQRLNRASLTLMVQEADMIDY